MTERIKRPFLLSGIVTPAVLAGIMAFGTDFIFPVFAISAFICIFLCIKKSCYMKHLAAICLVITVSSLSFVNTEGIYNTVKYADGINAEITGTVISFSEKTSGSYFGTEVSSCSADGIALPGKIVLYSDFSPDISPGDKIETDRNELQLFVSDGVFHYHDLSEKAYLRSFVNSIEITEKHSEGNLYFRILQLRKWFNDKLSENMTENSAAITSALITGDKSSLSPETEFSFRMSGISHIFAVSGMHLSLWTGFFFIIMKQRAKTRFLPNMLAIVFVLFYIVFAGFSPSVLRAGIMLIPTFIASIVRKKADALNSLGLAGTLLLLINPFLAGNVSFLLSYIATFALVGVAPYFTLSVFSRNKILHKLKKPFVSVLNSILISLCVIMLTLPVTTVFFGYVSLLSPVSSLLMTPIAEMLMVTGTLSVLFPSGNIISTLLFGVSEFLSNVITDYVFRVSVYEFAIIPTDPKFILLVFFVTASISVFLIFILKKHRAAVIILIISLIISICVTFIPLINTSEDTELYVSFSESSASAVVSSNDGSSAYYTDSPDYEHMSEALSMLTSKGELRADYYLSAAKGTHEKNINRLFLPKVTLQLYKNNTESSEKIKLWDNTYFASETYPAFRAAVFFIDGIKTVIITTPLIDVYYIDDIFTSGDILICRDEIPEGLKKNSFGEIFVLKTKDNTDKAENTSDKIRITVKGDSYAVH